MPALKLDGRKVQGSRDDRPGARPDPARPAALPGRPRAARRGRGGRGWGDEELQPPIRQIIWWAFKRDSAPLASYSEGARLGVPIGLAVKTGGADRRRSRLASTSATDENVRADLAALPGWLDRIDAWIADGVIGGDAAERRRLPDRRRASGWR